MTALHFLRSTLACCIGVACVSTAQAAGGAHLVDDADVETPGVCHLETWVSHHRHTAGGMATLAPACTFTALPRVEFGVSAEQAWGNETMTGFGPAIKINLMPVETGLGIGIAGSVIHNARAGRTDAARIVVPVSLALHDGVWSHFNAGWLYERTGARQHRRFAGTQLEVAVSNSLTLMGEMLTRQAERTGAQLGLRWSAGRKDLDLDLLIGRRIDGQARRTVTLGVSLRR
ncbi:hypothetical protein ACFO3A_14345 [Comamonas nitrativorans]|uniref:Outer membrane protein beta-barrel domain-containing protein n=1 Tax=Comamonas nitrativorans TaxID=108437 RepID=A0ABV9H313_9BURK